MQPVWLGRGLPLTLARSRAVANSARFSLKGRGDRSGLGIAGTAKGRLFMCGIVGVLKLKSSNEWQLPPAVTGRMVDTLRYRGPDGQGDWFSPDRNCWLGHTRLAIIDRAGGHQPMANEDGSVFVSFNGEIYNFLDVRAELVASGHDFKTKCDTEVLVHGYEEWGGEGLVQKLRGMFAFCVY